MHERIMNGKLFTDMCEGLPQERSDAKKRLIAFNQTTPDDLEKRFRIQRDVLHESSGNAWIEPPFYFCYGRHIIFKWRVNMNRLQNKSAVIIGATSGMGESIARMYAAEGAEVILRQLREYAVTTGAEFGFEMIPITWDPKYKGIDDLLHAKLNKCT